MEGKIIFMRECGGWRAPFKIEPTIGTALLIQKCIDPGGIATALFRHRPDKNPMVSSRQEIEYVFYISEIEDGKTRTNLQSEML